MILANRDHPLRLAGTGQIVLTRAKSRCSAQVRVPLGTYQAVSRFLPLTTGAWRKIPSNENPRRSGDGEQSRRLEQFPENVQGAAMNAVAASGKGAARTLSSQGSVAAIASETSIMTQRCNHFKVFARGARRIESLTFGGGEGFYHSHFGG